MRTNDDGRLEEARRKLPLPALAQQHWGHDPKSKRCPFCSPEKAKKGGAGIFQKGGRWWFKCFHSTCPTGRKALDEVGYLAQHTGVNNREAWERYLRAAGVWRAA